MQIKPTHLPTSSLSLALISLHVKITLLSLAHFPLTPTYCLMSLNTLSYFQYLSVPCSLSSPALSPDLFSYRFLQGRVHHSFYMGIAKPLTFLLQPLISLFCTCLPENSPEAVYICKWLFQNKFIAPSDFQRPHAKCCLSIYREHLL